MLVSPALGERPPVAQDGVADGASEVDEVERSVQLMVVALDVVVAELGMLLVLPGLDAQRTSATLVMLLRVRRRRKGAAFSPLGRTGRSRRRARSRGLNATSRIRSRPRALPSPACSSAGCRGARYARLPRPFARRHCLTHSRAEGDLPQ